MQGLRILWILSVSLGTNMWSVQPRVCAAGVVLGSSSVDFCFQKWITRISLITKPRISGVFRLQREPCELQE